MERKKRLERKKLFVSTLSLCLFFIAVALSAFIYTWFYKTNILIRPVPLSSPVSPAVQKDDQQLYLLTSTLEKQGMSISKKSIGSDNSVTLQLATGEVIIFSATKDLSEELSSLQVINSRLTMEGKRFSRLDLRFDKPVIVLK